jgi:hypothetical protein
MKSLYLVGALLLVAACGGKIAGETSRNDDGVDPSGGPRRGEDPGRTPLPPSQPSQPSQPPATAPTPTPSPDPDAAVCHPLTAPKSGTSCLDFHLAACQFKPILDGWYCTCDVKEGAGDPGAGPEKAIWVCEPFPFPDP